MTATVNTYVVRLVDLAKGRGNGAGLGNMASDIGQNLKNWFTTVCQKATTSSVIWNADVQWLAKPPSASPSQDAGSGLTVNMMLFLVPVPRDSVILLHPNYASGYALPAVTDRTITGETVTQGTISAGTRTPTLGISEIYIDRMPNRDVAARTAEISRIAFHESMHNQLRLDNAMHGRTGFAKEVPVGNAPDATNVNQMAAALGTLVPQWPGGFQAWLDWEKSRI